MLPLVMLVTLRDVQTDVGDNVAVDVNKQNDILGSQTV